MSELFLEIEECGSTNDVAAAELSLEGREFVSVISKRQKNGRGRNQKNWVSEEGGLFLSIGRKFKGTPHAHLLPLLAGAVVHGFLVERLTTGQCRVKWPNDIYLNDKKVGGILCEASSEGDTLGFVVGVGLNFDSVPIELQETAGSLKGFIVEDVSVIEFGRALSKRFKERLTDKTDPEWPERIVGYLRKNSYLKKNQTVSWMSAGEKQEGRFLGYNDLGQILVKPSGEDYASGEKPLKALMSEEVALVRVVDGAEREPVVAVCPAF